jgi:hypothetical protein
VLAALQARAAHLAVAAREVLLAASGGKLVVEGEAQGGRGKRRGGCWSCGYGPPAGGEAAGGVEGDQGMCAAQQREI